MLLTNHGNAEITIKSVIGSETQNETKKKQLRNAGI